MLSTYDTKYVCIDVKDFYFMTPIGEPEYMRIPVLAIPEKFINEYNLKNKVKVGYIYTRIDKGMYGLPQVGILVNILLNHRLEKDGYY